MRIKLVSKSLLLAAFYLISTFAIAWLYKEDILSLYNSLQNKAIIYPFDILRVQSVVPSITFLIGIYYIVESLLILIRPINSR